MINLTKFYIYVWLMIIMPSHTFAQFKLTKVEEFTINALSDLDILDYFPSKKIYLGFIKYPKGNDIALVNAKGEIITKKNLVGEGPNQSISHINCMAFSKDGDIWLQSATHFLLYDQELVLKERFSYPSSLGIQIRGRKEYFSYFYQDGMESGFSFITNPSNTNTFSNNKELDKNLIEIYTPGIDKLFKIAPAAERKMYKRFSSSLISSLYFITYTIDNSNKLLYLTTRTDDEITVYNLKTHMLLSRLKVNHGEFNVLGVNSISRQDLPSIDGISLGAKNHQLFLLDEGQILLDYVKEIAHGIYEQKKAINPYYHHYNDPSFHRLILFDKKKQLSGDIPMPKNGHLMISLPGNRLLFKIKNPDVEEDFIRYEIYQMVKN